MRRKPTQKEIARMVDVSCEHLCRLLKKRAEPKVGLAIRIANAMGKPVEELWKDWAGHVIDPTSSPDPCEN